jgi:hypothetical protein
VYTGVPFLSLDWRKQRAIAIFLFFAIFELISLLTNIVMGFYISPTAAILECALIFPVLMALTGNRISPAINAVFFIRALNILACILSFRHLIVDMGFPLRLPYIHYLPDHYWSAFGIGGAKIVTVIGFFGLAELFTAKEREGFKPPRWLFGISALNFLMPNFLLGVLAGSLGLSILLRRHTKLVFLVITILLIVAPYALTRFDNINGKFEQTYGMHPKIFAYYSVFDVFSEKPGAMFVGTGLGQYGSQPALWKSPISEIISSQSIPDLPGLFAAEVHLEYLSPILMTFSKEKFALSSSFNKPYTGWSITLIELGLPVTLFLLWGLYAYFWRGKNMLGKCVFVFTLTVNILDNQMDVPWFGMLLLAVGSILQTKPTRATAEPVIPPKISGVQK